MRFYVNWKIRRHSHDVNVDIFDFIQFRFHRFLLVSISFHVSSGYRFSPLPFSIIHMYLWYTEWALTTHNNSQRSACCFFCVWAKMTISLKEDFAQFIVPHPFIADELVYKYEYCTTMHEHRYEQHGKWKKMKLKNLPKLKLPAWQVVSRFLQWFFEMLSLLVCTFIELFFFFFQAVIAVHLKQLNWIEARSDAALLGEPTQLMNEWMIWCFSCEVMYSN